MNLKDDQISCRRGLTQPINATKSSQAYARLVKVRRELVFRRPAERVQFDEVVQAVSEGCRFQQEELDDEEADLKSEEVSRFQTDLNYTHIHIKRATSTSINSHGAGGQSNALLSSDAKHLLSTFGEDTDGPF